MEPVQRIGDQIIIDLIDYNEKYGVEVDEDNCAKGIALALSRNIDTIHIKYNDNIKIIQNILTFLEHKYYVKDIDIHQHIGELIITKIGDQQ